MITKTHFIEVIEALHQQHLEDKKNADVVGMMFNTDDLNLYDNSLLQKAIIGMLRMWFPVDAEGYCSLTDYCYTLDFGKQQTLNVSSGLYETTYESPGELYDRLVLLHCVSGLTAHSSHFMGAKAVLPAEATEKFRAEIDKSGQKEKPFEPTRQDVLDMIRYYSMDIELMDEKESLTEERQKLKEYYEEMVRRGNEYLAKMDKPND